MNEIEEIIVGSIDHIEPNGFTIPFLKKVIGQPDFDSLCIYKYNGKKGFFAPLFAPQIGRFSVKIPHDFKTDDTLKCVVRNGKIISVEKVI